MMGYPIQNLYSQPGDAEWARDFAVLQDKKSQEYFVYFKIFFNAAGRHNIRPGGVQRL